MWTQIVINEMDKSQSIIDYNWIVIINKELGDLIIEFTIFY